MYHPGPTHTRSDASIPSFKVRSGTFVLETHFYQHALSISCAILRVEMRKGLGGLDHGTVQTTTSLENGKNASRRLKAHHRCFRMSKDTAWTGLEHKMNTPAHLKAPLPPRSFKNIARPFQTTRIRSTRPAQRWTDDPSPCKPPSAHGECTEEYHFYRTTDNAGDARSRRRPARQAFLRERG